MVLKVCERDPSVGDSLLLNSMMVVPLVVGRPVFTFTAWALPDQVQPANSFSKLPLVKGPATGGVV